MTIRVRRFILNAAIVLALCLIATIGVDQSSASSIKIPPGTSVKVHGHSAAVAMDNGIAGTYNCSCTNGMGNAAGTCSLTSTGTVMVCTKGTARSCNGTCSLTTTTTGLNGAMAARARAASQNHMAPAAH